MKYLVRANNHISKVDQFFEADSDMEAVFRGLTIALFSLARDGSDYSLETSINFFKVTHGNRNLYEISGETREIVQSILEEL